MTELQKKFQAMDLWPYKGLDKKRDVIIFSPCSESDFDALARMYDTFEPKVSVQGLPPLDKETRDTWIRNCLKLSLNIKAELDGRIISQGMLSPFLRQPMLEFALFVHNEYQLRGLGFMMSLLLQAVSKKLDFKKLWVCEQRDNSRAVNLHIKTGFTKIRHERNEIEFEFDVSRAPDKLDLTNFFAHEVVKPSGKIILPEYLTDQELFSDTKSVFIFSPHFDQFKLPEEHPFKTNRSRLTLNLMSNKGLTNLSGTQILGPPVLDEKSILTYLTPQYYYCLEMADRGEFMPQMLEYGLGTNDNPVIHGIMKYSALAAGASVMGADLLVNSQVDTVFSPTGGFHHAGPNHCAGFCYVNDVVLAIKYLLQLGKRVLYIDIDAHHGDGVQFAFYDEPRVLNISLHESGRTLFPWNSGFENEIGEENGYGFNVNVPLAPGTNDEIYREAFYRVVPPLAESFKADVCVAVIGVDTMYSDPLSNLSLTNNVYADLVLEMKKFAPKLLLLGGGGYNENNIAKAWTLAWAVLHDAEPGEDYFGQVGTMVSAAETGQVTLRDTYPFIPPSKVAEARAYAHTVVRYIEKHVLPVHK